MLYVRVICFVWRGCTLSRGYIHVCNCVVNVYLHHLKLCVVYIDGRMYVYCSEYNIVSQECIHRIYRIPLLSLAEELGRGRQLMASVTPYDIVQMDLSLTLILIIFFASIAVCGKAFQ